MRSFELFQAMLRSMGMKMDFVCDVKEQRRYYNGESRVKDVKRGGFFDDYKFREEIDDALLNFEDDDVIETLNGIIYIPETKEDMQYELHLCGFHQKGTMVIGNKNYLIFERTMKKHRPNLTQMFTQTQSDVFDKIENMIGDKYWYINGDTFIVKNEDITKIIDDTMTKYNFNKIEENDSYSYYQYKGKKQEPKQGKYGYIYDKVRQKGPNHFEIQWS